MIGWLIQNYRFLPTEEAGVISKMLRIPAPEFKTSNSMFFVFFCSTAIYMLLTPVDANLSWIFAYVSIRESLLELNLFLSSLVGLNRKLTRFSPSCISLQNKIPDPMSYFSPDQNSSFVRLRNELYTFHKMQSPLFIFRLYYNFNKFGPIFVSFLPSNIPITIELAYATR